MKSASRAWGLAFVLVLLLPFAAVGVVTATLAAERVVHGDLRQALFLGVFALSFGAVGVGGIAAAIAGNRKLKEQTALEARHQDQPWLWRQDWASGRINDSSRKTVIVAWIFTALWNLVSFPGALFGVRASIKEGDHVGLVALLFPAVGIGFLVWAVRATIRYRKYGSSQLRLSTIPGAIGRSLRGTVSVPSSLQPADGFRATLSCIRQVTTGSGKTRSTTESILWQEDREVRGLGSRGAAGMVTSVPVSFRLPADAIATDGSNPRNCVLWRLSLSAEVPGVDYDADFEVPVFRTAASDEPLTPEEEQLIEDADAGDKYQQSQDSRIVVTTNRRGTEIVFPAARNPGAAAGLTVFTLIWLAAIAFQLYLDVPIVFPIVSGLFGILLLVGMLDLWLGVSRVNVDAGMVTVATGYLFPGRERTVKAAEISDVRALIGMRSGATPYYDITIVRKKGRKIRAGRGVRDKREAEWLAATIKEALG